MLREMEETCRIPRGNPTLSNSARGYCNSICSVDDGQETYGSVRWRAGVWHGGCDGVRTVQKERKGSSHSGRD